MQNGDYRWPPDNGFDAPPTYLVLPAGVLLDRFGSDYGRFFSPKGATFGARALPTVCANLVYSVFRVQAPLPVRIGSAAPWFDEPGGAMQVQTDASAAQLIADGTLRRVDTAASPCDD
ncbi:MAG: TNT domain-containing protein [Paracoccus sp. (in: a-proteobacteria)]